ncbi:MAG: TetR/AcrR family transcriptional regulator [Bacteroidota bacterium]
MSKLNQLTKQKILSAAETVFHENGFQGARTTLIAKKAGVSRPMLHYYYRTKEDLFHEVLRNSFSFFLTHAQDAFSEETNVRLVINKLIDLLFEVLEEKPGLASFIMNILNENPALITSLSIIEKEQIPALFDKLLEEARDNNEIQSAISGENLLLNIYGLIVMPYLYAPLIRFKENRDENEMKMFLQKRKEDIKTFVWNGIKY